MYKAVNVLKLYKTQSGKLIKLQNTKHCFYDYDG